MYHISWRMMAVCVVISAAAAHFCAARGFCAAAPAPGAQGAQPAKKSAPPQPPSGAGDKIFASSCASCHGLDGRGGERAPNIAAGRVQQLSDVQIFGIIQHGIPGTGMPGFRSLADSDIKSVVAYLRTLQGAKKTIASAGDAKQGEALFFGKAGCSACHMAAGQGGFIASDLSSYAGTHSVDETRSAVTNPNPGDTSARVATVTVSSGEKYAGRVRNEDNFSLQMQSLDGTFHSFAKPDIQSVEYSPQSLMPSNYGSTLTSEELNELIGYLTSVAGGESKAPKNP